MNKHYKNGIIGFLLVNFLIGYLNWDFTWFTNLGSWELEARLGIAVLEMSFIVAFMTFSGTFD